MIRLKKTKTIKEDRGISGRIGNSVLRAQRKAADYLNGKTAHWSPRRVKMVLFLFCLFTGNICLYITGKAILCANGPPEKTRLHRQPKTDTIQQKFSIHQKQQHNEPDK